MKELKDLKIYTRQEIIDTYPDQWVGITDMVFPDGDCTNWISARVKYIEGTKDELNRLVMIDKEPGLKKFWTSPHKVKYGNIIVEVVTGGCSTC